MNEREFKFISRRYPMIYKIKEFKGNGVRFLDEGSVYIGPDVEIGKGTIIFPNVLMLGKTRIGEDCTIEEGIRLEDSQVGNNSRICMGSRISNSILGNNCEIWEARMYNACLGDNIVVHSPNRIVWSKIGSGSRIESYCFIKYAEIGMGCTLGPQTIIEGEKFSEEELARGKRSIKIARDCKIGAQAHLHDWVIVNPEAEIAHCEIKRSFIGTRTIIKHLGYVGDATIYRDCNIGAGTVFGNWGGRAGEKHRTIVRPGVFIGINTSIIAESVQEIGSEAYIGAHTLVTKGVEANTVVIREVGPQKVVKRSRRTKNGWETTKLPE